MTKMEIPVRGLDCTDCTKVIKPGLSKIPGVESVEVDFVRGSVKLQGKVDPEVIKKRLHELGFEAVESHPKDNGRILDFKGFWQYFFKMPELKLLIPGMVLFLLTILFKSRLSPSVALILQLALLPVAGWNVFRNAFISLFKEHTLNINFLMSLASTGAVIIGEGQEALILLVLFNISEALEGYTNDRARSVLTEFADLAPKTALLVNAEGETLVPIEAVHVDDVLIIRPGDRFPMDGLVLEGSSEVNEAPITGESRLVPKTVGDEVLSSTVNGQGALKVKVTRPLEDNTIQRIITLVTEAQANKARQEKFIDRFSRVYTPLVVLAALLAATIPTIFLDQPFWNTTAGYGWLHRSLSLLLVGCPCALIISVPITMISGLTRAAKEGVIFKGGVFLESLAQAKVVAFDKTGTLTRGRPSVISYKSVDCRGEDNCVPCNDLLAIASSVEQYSAHPLGIAVLEKAKEQGVQNQYRPAENVVNLEGRGQQGIVEGKLATIGSLPLFLEEHKPSPELVAEAKLAEIRGQTTMLVCDGERVRGYLAAQDEVRGEAEAVLKEVKMMGMHTAMLTGDNASVAEKIGQALKLDEIKAALLPAEKLEALSKLREQYGPVIMVGDGINDSPALARADVGVAMGGAGNAQVLETADVVLMNDDLTKLPFALRLSRFTYRLVRTNIFVSLGVKLLVAMLALLGLTPLWVAVFADMGISLLVALNGLRAMRFETGAAQ